MGEIFNEDKTKSYFHFLKRLQTKEPDAFFPSRSVENFLRYVDRCRKKAFKARSNHKCLLLDIKYNQAHLICPPWWSPQAMPRLFSLIREQDWRVVDVHRESVGTHISNQIAMKTGTYHRRGSENPNESVKVHIDPATLLQSIASTSATKERVQAAFDGYTKYLRVDYEDMFDAGKNGQFSDALLGRLSDFFGIEKTFDPVPKLKKVLQDDPFAHVENADELREALRRSGALTNG